MLLAPPREFGHGPQIPLRNPGAYLDVSVLRLRPHAGRFHATGREQVSMQELWQAVPERSGERALVDTLRVGCLGSNSGVLCWCKLQRNVACTAARKTRRDGSRTAGSRVSPPGRISTAFSR